MKMNNHKCCKHNVDYHSRDCDNNKCNDKVWLLCEFQLNTGLRISDVVSVQVHNLITDQNNFKDNFILNEKNW